MIDKAIRYRAVVHYERFYRSLRGVSKIYSVSKSSLQRWINSEPRIPKSRTSKTISSQIKTCIQNALVTNPCMTLNQICGLVSKECNIYRSTSTAHSWIKQMKYSRKKVYATIDHTPSDSISSSFCSIYSTLSNDNIICIDEAGFYVGEHARYGYSKKGNRIHVPSSRTLRKSRFTLIMAISATGVVHYQILTGNCDKEY